MKKFTLLLLLNISTLAFAEDPKTTPQTTPTQSSGGGISMKILDQNPTDHPSVIIGNPDSVIVNPNNVLIEGKALHEPMPNEQIVFTSQPN